MHKKKLFSFQFEFTKLSDLLSEAIVGRTIQTKTVFVKVSLL